jgi:hypothetical protein
MSHAQRIGLTALIALVSVTQAGAAEPDGFQRWRKQRDAILKDEALIAYYDFQEGKDDTLINHAGAGEALNGTIHNGTWIEGRWPGKKALQFNGKNTYVSVAHDSRLSVFDVDSSRVRRRLDARGAVQRWRAG